MEQVNAKRTRWEHGTALHKTRQRALQEARGSAAIGDLHDAPHIP